MKKKTKIIIGVLVFGALGFLYWNNTKKIEDLKRKLLQYNSTPPSKQIDPQNYREWIDTALQLYKSVEALFAPGGPFAKKGSPSKNDVLDVYNSNGGYEHYA